MAAVLVCEKLSKWYGNILGISDVSLEIHAGVKGLLGPNGAGKSTFLKLCSGQLKPSFGSLKIFNAEVFSNWRLFSRIGFCPEFDSYYAGMRGGQFLAFLIGLHGLKRSQALAKSAAALELVGLQESGDRLIRAYSFGMRQRLRLAASLIHDPELLVLDEPLRGVDPLWRIRIIKMIKEFGRQGKTVLVSSHILPEIESMTNEIILIHQGKIFAEGDVHYIRGLIDKHPHQVSLKSSEARRLASRLVSEGFVLSVNFSATGLVVETNDRDRFSALLMRLISEDGYGVEEITSPDDNLQAVFDYLIGK
jgi:ABC-2 type transport system ATP-binding protein